MRGNCFASDSREWCLQCQSYCNMVYDNKLEGRHPCMCGTKESPILVDDDDVDALPSDSQYPDSPLESTAELPVPLTSFDIPDAKLDVEAFIYGSQCQDFAHNGKHQGIAGRHMQTFWMAAAELRQRKPDWAIYEMSDLIPHALIQEAFGETFNITFFPIKPSLLGIPAKKPRLYVFLSLPVHALKGHYADFEKLNACATVMTADMFLCSSDEARLAAMKAMAAQYGNHVAEDSDTVDWEYVLTPFQKVRLQQHDEVFKNQCMGGVQGCYVTDSEQNLGFTTGGPMMPGMITHGKLVSLSKNKMYLPEEHLLAMGDILGDELLMYVSTCAYKLAVLFKTSFSHLIGENMFPKQGGKFDYPCLFLDLVKENKLTNTEMKLLAGNSMHLIVLGTLMMYCLGRLELNREYLGRKTLQKMSKESQASSTFSSG